MESAWYIQTESGEIKGPIAPAVLKARADAGMIKPDTPVREAAGGDWVPAGRVKGLFSSAVQPGATTPPPVARPAAPPQTMSSAGWYISLGNQVHGPLSESQLRELAQRGSVTAQTPVSRDKTKWMAAAAVQGIVFGVVPPPRTQVSSPPSPQSARGGRFSKAWPSAGVLAGIGGLLCAVLVLTVIGALVGSGESHCAPSTTHVVSPSNTAADQKPVARAPTVEDVPHPEDAAAHVKRGDAYREG